MDLNLVFLKEFRAINLVTKFNIFRTVHLRLMLVDNQLAAQFFYNTFI